jgi:hypothetical protein
MLSARQQIYIYELAKQNQFKIALHSNDEELKKMYSPQNASCFWKICHNIAQWKVNINILVDRVTINVYNKSQ